MNMPPPSDTENLIEMIKRGELGPEDICRAPMPTLNACMNELLGKKGKSVDSVAELAGMHRSSVFRILKGETTPPRDTLLSLGFAMGLEYAQMQTLLMCGECAGLNKKNRRDALLIYSISKELALGDVDDLLRKEQFDPLTKPKAERKPAARKKEQAAGAKRDEGDMILDIEL